MFSPLQLLSASDDMSFVFMMFMNVYVEALPFFMALSPPPFNEANDAKELKNGNKLRGPVI